MNSKNGAFLLLLLPVPLLANPVVYTDQQHPPTNLTPETDSLAGCTGAVATFFVWRTFSIKRASDRTGTSYLALSSMAAT